MNQGNTANVGTLDYGRPPRNNRLKRWVRRIGLLLLTVAVIYGGMLGWLWWDWHREQQAIVTIQAGGGKVYGTYHLSIPVVERLLSWRFNWLLDRVYSVQLSPSTCDLDLVCIERFKGLKGL